MPLYAFIGRDGSRGLELRKDHRPAHLAGIEALDGEGRVVHAGPLLDAAGAPCGSLIVFEAGSLEAAREQAAGDPYVVEGIFESFEVLETKRIFPSS